MHDEHTPRGYPRTTVFIISVWYIFALLTVNLAVSTRPTVLQTKKGYGMIVLVPLKRRNEANDVTTGDF